MNRTLKRLTVRQREKLFRDIEKHTDASYYSIAKEHNVTVGYVSSIARNKFGRKPRKEMFGLGSHRKWTAQKIDQYLKQKDSTIRRVTKTFDNVKSKIKWRCTLCNNEWNCCFDTIKQRVEHDLSMVGCPACGYDTSTLYHDFLNDLTPETAYFLGVFYAKGRISKSKTLNGKRIIITANNIEKLEKIQKLLASSYEVKSERNSNSFYISVKSPHLISKLKEYKSINSMYDKPKSIPKVIRDNKDLFAHFLRGYIDNLGYVELLRGTSSTLQARVSIPVSLSFAKEIQQFFKKSLKRNKTTGYVTKRSSKEGNKASFTELHISGIYATYDFLKLIYNSSVSPIKYMSNSNYDKFLEIQHELSDRAEKNLKIRELLKEYKSKTDELIGCSDIVEKHKLSPYKINLVKSGKAVKDISSKKRKQIIKDLKKTEKTKDQSNKILERAVTLTGISPKAFVSLSRGRWKNSKKYTDKIDNMPISCRTVTEH